MYNETYDDYIRSILGYPNNSCDSCNSGYPNYSMQNNVGYNMNVQRSMNDDLERYYPEIYKIVQPMVVKSCQSVVGNVTDEQLENMTDEIYFALESKTSVELNINLTNDVRSSNSNTKPVDKTADVRLKEKTETRETRQINRGLRDLIKILIIRELLNRPGMRPPMPPRPPRPPVRPPMRPPYQPGRPPQMREFDASNYELYDIYEM